jgi:Mg2+-importing ATPase
MEKDTKTYWQYTHGEWFETLQSGPQGLTDDEALKRRNPGMVDRSRRIRLKNNVKLFISQFTNPLMLLLLTAVLLSGIIGATEDTIIIFSIVIVTGLVGFYQEYNADNVIARLQSLTAIKSMVIRSGAYKEVLSEDIVVGDVIVFNAGDIIPADCLVTEANELYINEASLTGESFPVRKIPGVIVADAPLTARTNCLWEGTSIVSGKGRGLVVNTGADTVYGEIIQSAATVVETTFEKGLKDYGYFLIRVTLILCVVILGIHLLAGKALLTASLFALALAVGMAPELLPAITTISMSQGARRLLKKKVVVKKLTSIQNLGEVNLLCTDKTGTLTEGRIEVAGIVNAAGETEPYATQLAWMNARYQTGYSNAIDDALQRMDVALPDGLVKLDEIPYDFIRKRLSVAIGINDEKLLITKGAVDQIMEICNRVRMADGEVREIGPYREALEAASGEYGEKGMRVLAICYRELDKEDIEKEDEREMVFAGFILLKDPIKQGVREALATLSSLDVGIKIITGDNVHVARSIAREIGITDPVIMTGSELRETSTEALSGKVSSVHIFAGVEPQQKERIIRECRKHFTVAYLGDGINDVSAISAADLGISVNNAADVTREAADVVLMEKEIGVLAAGIKEGRKTFANTLKYIYITTGATFGNMVSMTVTAMLLPFLPMLPKQILLTNFISDFPFMMIASDSVDSSQLRTPGRWNLKAVHRYTLVYGLHSSIFDLITFISLYYILRVNEQVFQTGWFIESVLSELLILFVVRSYKPFLKSKPSMPLLILTIISVSITIILPYLPVAGQLGLVPLPFYQLFVVLGIIVIYIITADWLKRRYFFKN